MDLDIYQVDSFTTEAFKGNPAGVCITEHGLTEVLMLSIAEEMAVSETAFLSLFDMKLRWFTPEVEVALCGHGTLAVAHILKEIGIASIDDTIIFNTLSGVLSAKLQDSSIALDFPATELTFTDIKKKDLLLHLGIEEKDVVSFGQFDTKDFIEIKSEAALRNLSPNFDGLKQLTGRGVLVTAESLSDELDFVSRYFAPWVGINEDPVTGSAHCALTVYWSNKLNKLLLNGYQASSRGGYISTELLPTGRIKLIGSAVTTIKGKLII
ncbi:PhzF family phenazine biosynthesis protein [Aliivibrio sp. EL58]|uniref:PhzF family phenazine biosynthesis protein n=1 Tax=Aliivibrio sp. EL58 TaxID=2107582 RepID=UPI000EFB88CC|nr:PhzF family phenazine biosynthesis protein [Aliivibrio sp. EL58]